MANNNIHINVTTNADTADKSIRSLDTSITKSVARASSLTKSFKFLDRAVNSGKIDLIQYAQAVDRLNKEETELYKNLGRTNTVMKTQAAVAGQVGRRMSRTGVMYQQAGYQIGDFLVQVQSGTNALVAFGQQATQMVGTLTLLGGKFLAIGTVLGIAIPLVTAAGAAFMRTRGEAKTFEEQLRSLKELTDDLKSSQDFLSMSTQDLSEKYGNAYESVRRYATLEAELRSSIARSELGKSVSELSVAAREYGFAGSERGNRRLSQSIRKISEDFKVTRQEARLLERSFASIAASQTFEHQRDSVEDLINNMKILNVTTDQVPESIRNMLLEFIEVNENAAEAEALMESIANIDMASGISEAARQARILAEKMGISLGLALDLVNIAGKSREENRFESMIRSGMVPEAARGDFDVSGGFDTPLKLQQYIKGVESRLKSREKPFGGGSGGVDALANLRQRIKLDTRLLGLSKERQQVERAIANSNQIYSEQAISNVTAELEAYNTKLESMKRTEALYDSMGSSLERGLMSIVDQTKSVGDALKEMARSIVAELYRVYVVQRMVGEFKTGIQSSGIGGMLGRIMGFDGGGYTGSGPRSGGLDGRGGYLAMVHPRETIVDHTKAGSSDGGGTTITQNFYFQANGDESVKRLIAEAAPSISNAAANRAKQLMIDDRRRGGMKSTFG